MTPRATITILLSVILAGCGFFSRTKSRFFTLDLIAPAAGVVAITGIPIGVDVVELPPGMDRREVIVTKADHRLEIRERDQWSASLEPLILHTLAHDLAQRLPTGMVILPGQPAPATPTRSVDLIVERLTAGPENRLYLDARWTLRERATTRLTRYEEIRVDMRSLDSAEVATALSTAVATLADRIVAGAAGPL